MNDEFMYWVYSEKRWTIEKATQELKLSEKVIQRAITDRPIHDGQAKKIRDAGYTGYLNVGR